MPKNAPPFTLPGMGISEKLRELRERKGMSQRDLAKACGVTYQSIQYWERPDGGAPRHARLEKLASVLGVTVAELVQDSGERFPGIADDARELVDELLRLAKEGRLSDTDIALLRDLVSRLTGTEARKPPSESESDWVFGMPDRRRPGVKKVKQ